MSKRLLCFLCILLLACALSQAESPVPGGVADASEMTDVLDVVDPSKTPVTADMLQDGVYEVNVDTSSAMFKVLRALITVQDGGMTVQLHMKSSAYSYLYPGSAEEAAQAQPDALSALESGPEGELFFTLPLPALDVGYACAAYSARKQLWYPRTLVFRADSLPLSAWKAEFLQTPQRLGLSDGAYHCEVTLTGAGRATLLSPAALHIQAGACTAEIQFSTAKIDYLLVEGTQYFPLRTEEGAVFQIPVAAFDLPLALIVDSTAMKPAVEVPYTVTFASDTLVRQEGEDAP